MWNYEHLGTHINTYSTLYYKSWCSICGSLVKKRRPVYCLYSNSHWRLLGVKALHLFHYRCISSFASRYSVLSSIFELWNLKVELCSGFLCIYNADMYLSALCHTAERSHPLLCSFQSCGWLCRSLAQLC